MGIKTAYMPFPDIDQQPEAWKDSMLGAICFYEHLLDNSTVKATGIPITHLHAPILAGAAMSSEIWLSDLDFSLSNPLSSESKGAIQYRFSNDWLFGVITMPELVSLQNTTQSAYQEIFALMQALDYPHIYRFWNYMADINGVSQGLERYRQFNVGRKHAFLACDDEIGKQMPAACALGLTDGPLTIAFLLGRQAPIAIENPRQVSAYEYPMEHGPCTPSFSRATLLRTQQNEILFISGTASIVGHQTLHALDVVAQTRETLDNLQAVITEANRILGEQRFELTNIDLRVYIRYAADLMLVQNEMKRYIGGTLNAIFIQADICRQALLLEIEATAIHLPELVHTKCS